MPYPCNLIFRYAVALALLLVLYGPGMAASHREDSLLQRLGQLPQDSNRVNTLNELLKLHLGSQPLRAIAYGQEALMLAQQIGYTSGVARLCNNLGVLQSRQGDYQKALSYYARARTALSKLNDSIGSADCEMNIGSVLYKMGDYPNALVQYTAALGQYRILGDTSRALAAVNNMGSVYMEQGRYPEAMEAYMAALAVRERLGDPQYLAQSYSNVGAIYQLEGSLDKAEEFFALALSQFEVAQDDFGKSASLNSLGEIALLEGRLDAAERLLGQALTTARGVADLYGIATAGLSLGKLHEQRGELVQAISAYEDALDTYRQMGRSQGTAQALSLLGGLHLRQGRYNFAQQALEESLEISDSLQALDLSRETHMSLADVMAALGQYRESYDHQRKAIALSDSLHSRDRRKQIAELQARYEASKQQEEINLLNLQAAQDELRIAESTTRNAILTAVVVLVVVLLVILVWRNLSKQRHRRRLDEKNAEIKRQRDLLEAQNQQIREINANLEQLVEQRSIAVRSANAELDTFLYESAHALRRPLLRITGLQDIIEAEQDSLVRDRLRGQIRITLAGMDELLHKLILVSESAQRPPKLEPVRLLPLVMEIVSQQPLAESFSTNLEGTEALLTDERLLRGLVSAVLENAFRFQDLGHGRSGVSLELSRVDGQAILRIKDAGAGLEEEYVSKVFDMFFRGPNQRGGNGLGLYIARRICSQLHGTITFDSVVGEGSTVTILLPDHAL